MEAGELRIGNWIERDGKVCKVHALTIFCCGNLHKPLTLTEEWLLRLGAEKHESLIIDSYRLKLPCFETELKELSITLQRGNQYVFLRCGDLDKPREEDEVITIFNGDSRRVELQVHYIQNLYYTLTGIELEEKGNLVV